MTKPSVSSSPRITGVCAGLIAAAVLITAATGSIGALAAEEKRADKGAAHAAAETSMAKGAVVDINAADAAALETLPGIGPSLARRIVDYRKENGPFKSVDELLNVRGIGEKSLARFRDRVTVGGRR